MARYQLRLKELPDEVRTEVVEASRSCGPPFDKVAFNSVLTGSRELPAIIAESDDQARLEALSKTLGDAGAAVEITDAMRGGVTLGPAKSIVSLIANLPDAPVKVRVAAIGGAALIIGALIAVVAMLLSGDPEPVSTAPDAGIADAAVVAATPDTATVAVDAGAVVEPDAGPPPSQFADFLANLGPDEAPCGPDVRPMACAVRKLRGLADELKVLTASTATTAAVAAEPGKDGGRAEDATPGDAAPIDAAAAPARPAADIAPMVRILEHRIVRCLANEGSRPQPGDEASVHSALEGLKPQLAIRYRKEDCTTSRRAMYECMLAARTEDCDATYGRLIGALNERDLEEPVPGVASGHADAVWRRLLDCAMEERREPAQHLEHAHLRTLRTQLAVLAESRSCGANVWLTCTATVSHMPCEALGDLLDPSAVRLFARLAADCAPLAKCARRK